MKKIKSLVALAAFAGTFSLPAFAQTADGDGDGVADSVDVFPCESRWASMQAVPGENAYSTLLVEDQWPSQGDYDFNDAVLDYNVELYKNAAGLVDEIRYTVNPRAMGAAFDNGLALHLPVTRAAASGVQVTRTIGAGSAVSLTPLATESDLVVVLSNNMRQDLFSNASGQINTNEANSAVNGQSVVVRVRFATPLNISGAAAPFDLFIFRSGEFGHQIHLSRFSGTDGMRQNLFGTLNDGSNASKKFVDQQGVPFILEVPSTAKFPQEGKRVDALFPRIVDFAASGGAQFTDFFNRDVVNTQSYRNSLPAAPTVAVLPQRTDQSCTIKPASCKAILDAGQSTGDGNYIVDPDGSGGNAPFSVFCDMTRGGLGFLLGSNAINNVTSINAACPAGTQPFQVRSATHAAALKAFIKRGGDNNQYWANHFAGPNTSASSVIANQSGYLSKDGVWRDANITEATDLAPLNFSENANVSNIFDPIPMRGQDGYSNTAGAPTVLHHSGEASITGKAVCMPATAGLAETSPAVSCKAIKDAGFSVGNGTYWIDADGAGGNAAVELFCDMTSDGGGWTLVAKVNTNSGVTLGEPANWFQTRFNVGFLVDNVLVKDRQLASIGSSTFVSQIKTDTIARFEFVAEDDNNQRAKFFKRIASTASFTNWFATDPTASTVCIDVAFSQQCANGIVGKSGDVTLFGGMTLTKYGFPAGGGELHMRLDNDGAPSFTGVCSSTGNNNSNQWRDDAFDGHWGNGLLLWVR